MSIAVVYKHLLRIFTIEFIFILNRLPGRKSTVSRYVDQFDKGLRPVLEARDGVHSIASLLKLYLIQLPYSLVPPSIYEDVMKFVIVLLLVGFMT